MHMRTTCLDRQNGSYGIPMPHQGFQDIPKCRQFQYQLQLPKSKEKYYPPSATVRGHLGYGRIAYTSYLSVKSSGKCPSTTFHKRRR